MVPRPLSGLAKLPLRAKLRLPPTFTALLPRVPALFNTRVAPVAMVLLPVKPPLAALTVKVPPCSCNNPLPSKPPVALDVPPWVRAKVPVPRLMVPLLVNAPLVSTPLPSNTVPSLVVVDTLWLKLLRFKVLPLFTASMLVLPKAPLAPSKTVPPRMVVLPL
ncbi:hypothetical protein SRDD_38330 [Serratia sp. DD3]|nr:hypothetical protein SRDD_38330 [Serratia sp. DD3]